MFTKVHVEGKNKGDILIFALSTCGWCRKTKNYLRDEGIAFDYVDVDLLSDDDSDDAMEILDRFNRGRSFPTVILNNELCMVGFNEEKLTEIAQNE